MSNDQQVLDSKVKRYQKGLVLSILGIIFLLIHININTGKVYPDYNFALGDRTIIQKYTISQQYGANTTEIYNPETGMMVIGDIDFKGFRIDLFHDLVGLVLLILGFSLLKERNPLFRLGIISAGFAFLLQTALILMPFFVNGIKLTTVAFFLSVATCVAKILTTYSFVSGICACIPGTIFQNDRKSILLFWFGSFVTWAVVSIITWLMLNPFLIGIYYALQILSTAIYLARIIYLRNYITGQVTSIIS